MFQISHADIIVSHEDKEECFFLCVSFSSFLLLWRKVFIGNSPGNYPQIPLARIGHMSVPNQW